MRHAGPSKAAYLRRRIVVLGSAALVLAGGVFGVGYTVNAAQAPLPSATVSVSAPEAEATVPATLAWPEFRTSAIGAVGFDGILASTGEQGSVPIASITKIVTALVLLEAKPIPDGENGPTIEFTQRDVDIYHAVRANGGSWARVQAGERLTERDAIAAMVIPSANNYAISLANWAFGSQEAFLAAAASWLDAHGLNDTHLADSSGLDPASRSTPADLLEIAKLAVSDPVVGPIVATEQITLPGVGTEHNTNDILGVAGIDGVKTGFTDEAGHCLLFSADATVGSETVQLVGVVLGADSYDDMWDRVPPLVVSAVAGFHDVTVVTAGESVGHVTTAWGERAEVIASETITMLVFGVTPITSTVRVTPPVMGDRGDHVGTLETSAGQRTATSPLTLKRSLSPPDLWWRLTHPHELDAA